MSELDHLIKLLNENPTIRVEISGHTDDAGSDEYNLKLSAGRAESVVKYLTSKGISSNRLQAKGYGETQPIVPNDTPERQAMNRRTEFTILSK
jgi:outer membrane protein OmpA-like peptidoglycan-associated protein